MLQLKKFPDIPVSTREEERGSRQHPEVPRFCLVARDEGSFPCLVGKEFPAFPSHLKRRRSPQERREELQSRATIPRVPQMSQSIPEKPVFPALPRLSRRGSTPTTWARGTDLWESLVENPRGKSSWESHRSHDQCAWILTLLLPFWSKAHVHAPSRDEDLLLWGDARSTPRYMSALERKTHVPAPSPHKVVGSGTKGRGILRFRPRLHTRS